MPNFNSSAIICPTITSLTKELFETEVNNVRAFSDRIHFDLMDGQFAPTRSPDLDSIELPSDIASDIHLMYEDPDSALTALKRLRPKLLVFHYEANVDHEAFAAELKRSGIKPGLALLQTTPFEVAEPLLGFFDHVLIFSGNLGYHGGEAQLGLISKVKLVRQAFPGIEIGWDGGVNDTNAGQLVEAGVNVLNVGGYIQSAEDPAQAYANIEAAIKH